MFCVRLQGGGVYVYGGSVTFSSCTITGNSAGFVRDHAQKFPSPRWEIADALAPTHACTTANASVNFRMYVLQRPCKLPNAPMGKPLTHLPQLSLAQLRPTLRSTSGCTCRRDLQKFPSPRWDFHMFCAYACRAAVFTSGVAR